MQRVDGKGLVDVKSDRQRRSTDVKSVYILSVAYISEFRPGSDMDGKLTGNNALGDVVDCQVGIPKVRTAHALPPLAATRPYLPLSAQSFPPARSCAEQSLNA